MEGRPRCVPMHICTKYYAIMKIYTTKIAQKQYDVCYSMSLPNISIHQSDTKIQIHSNTRMWANAQPDGRPAERSWHPLFNAAKFG